MPYRTKRIRQQAPTVAAVLLPRERSRVEAAGEGCFQVVHRDSVPAAIRAVRERSVDAVLVSVHRCAQGDVHKVGHLVRDFPLVQTVALLSDHEAPASETLLHLGATGVQQVVDVTSPRGWQELRRVVGPPASRAVAEIRAPIVGALVNAPPDARLFFDALIRMAPEILTVRQLASNLAIRPSTLMSRFGRAGLPSPKSYLSGVRLLHAAYLFLSPGLSVADVAYQLEFSSPQSFGRHLRSMLGITATEFRNRFPFPLALERYIEMMIRPYLAAWRTFHPLANAERQARERSQRWRRPSPAIHTRAS